MARMERILEPEYMDTPEEAEGYDAMDHAEANRSFVEAFLAARGARELLHVADLGTGPGDIPILLAQQLPQAKVVGIDAAATMLALAKDKVAAAGLQDRIDLSQADVKALPAPDRHYQAVISNTILHHIPEPLGFLREAWRVCAEGGLLFIRDLYRPPTEDDARALVHRYAAEGTEQQQKLFFDSLHAALTLEEIRDVAEAAGLPSAHTHIEMTSDRHYTIRCFRD